MKIVLIISILLSLLGSLSSIESSLWECEPYLNPGGPNHPYCLSAFINSPGILFFFLTMVLFRAPDHFAEITIIGGIGSFIFYFIVGSIILLFFKWFKRLTAKE